MEKDILDYRNSILYTKSCSPNCDSEEDGIIEIYKKFILEEEKPGTKDGTSPTQDVIDTYEKSREIGAYRPRLISVIGFQELFELALDASWMHTRQNKTEADIERIFKEIEGLKEEDS